jgi:sialate O-acetylesterase
MKLLKLAVASLLCTPYLLAHAEVTLPRILADHMVLQRDVPIPVWGWAYPGEVVTVSLEKDSAVATADALGKWSVKLPARPAGGGPLKITIAGKNKIVLNDVLMGDVWFASGQSNMELSMQGRANSPVKDSAAEIASADIPEIRLLLVKQAVTVYPLADLKDAAPWQVCTPKTVATFSAIAFLFGREIHDQVKVPIGLIDSTWGGTPAESWTSLDGLASSPVLVPVMAARASDMNREADILQKFDADAEVAKVTGGTAPTHSGDKVNTWGPATLYNAMIAPFLNMPMKGVIWYQGESNTDALRAPHYEAVFENMITDWRSKWKSPEMPFLYAQIASFGTLGSNWVMVKDEQRRALRLPMTGMAVTVDVGEEKNIHPANKQAVGHRLALQAEAMVYGEKVVKDGPLFKQAKPMGGAIQISFDSAVGLKAKDGELGGFEVAGADGVFSPATAMIQGDTVIATSPAVSAPIYVRYAWAGFPKVANLYNAADLPASPFTSKDPVQP